MKKQIWFLVCAVLLTVFAPFSALVSAENGLPPLWDGTVAEGFAGGDGSEEDPFRIENAAQLAYFRDQVNTNHYFSNQYVRLCADIRLNDETFTFLPDTGLVKVTDGKNIAYLGTGMKGDNSGSNKKFDAVPSKKNTWYNEQYLSGGSYPEAELNIWSTIGITKNFDFDGNNISVQHYYFSGYFDGADHTIYGAFVPFLEDSNGFFAGIAGDAAIVNLNLENSLILGTDNAGGIVGAVTNSSNKVFATVRACSFDGVVIATECAGGIVGITHMASEIRLCANKGTVVGEEAVGGILGRGNNVRACINFGNIHGNNHVGGIAGDKGSETFGVISTPGIYRCTNHGAVTGKENVGGVVGRYITGSLLACHNMGYVKAQKNVGGIVGNSNYGMNNARTTNCYNTGKVEGITNVGGIAGFGNASNGYNTAEVVGQTSVGGITGGGNAAACRNDGDIRAEWATCGGIVGCGSAHYCCNYGTVTARRSAGGVAGSGSEYIKNCYNRGTVTATEGTAGGIAAFFSDTSTIVSCYNVGTVTHTKKYAWDGIGAIIGSYTANDGKIMYCYYLQGCAVMEGEEQPAIGYLTNENLDLSTVFACTEAQLKQAQTYTEYNFKSLWLF